MLPPFDPLSRFRFIIAITVMLLLMLGVMQWFKRFHAAGVSVESALLAQQFSEQVSLIHGQWLNAHYPEKIWRNSLPKGYFLMTSSGWPTDWVGHGEKRGNENSCEHLWLALMGARLSGEMEVREGGCAFLLENQRFDYIFANGNVMVH